MGQGVYMGLSTLLAEELEVTLDQIVAVPAPADASRYAHPVLGDQITGGSVTIRGLYQPMLQAGATARMMLIAAAAKEWGVSPATCRAAAGVVIHGATGRRLAYGALAAKAAMHAGPSGRAAEVTARVQVDRQASAAHRHPVQGRRHRAVRDRRAAAGLEVRGDCDLPDIWRHTCGRRRRFGARRSKGFDRSSSCANAVAVVADHTGAARKGLAALDDHLGSRRQCLADHATSSNVASMRRWPAMPLSRTPAVTLPRRRRRIANGVEATYRMPILPHTAMEPMNCTVHVAQGSLRCLGRNAGGRSRAQGRRRGDRRCRSESVTIHNHFLGGGFGRRLDHDGVVMAVRVAQQVDGPVQVVWSREEDIRHNSYRYLNLSRINIRLGPDGMPVSWRHRVVGPAIMARFLPIFFKDGIDFDIIDNAEGPVRHRQQARGVRSPRGPGRHADRQLAGRRGDAQRPGRRVRDRRGCASRWHRSGGRIAVGCWPRIRD